MASTTEESDGGGNLITSTGSTTIDLHPTGPNAQAVDQLTLVGDADYQMLPTDRFVATSANLTTTRIWTLPAAAAVSVGWAITTADSFGGVTTGTNDKIAVAAAGGDTVNGGSGVSVDEKYSFVVLRSDGVTKWTAIGYHPSLAPGTAQDVQANNISANLTLVNWTSASSLVNGRNDNVTIATHGRLRISGPSAIFSISGIVPTAILGSNLTNGLELRLQNVSGFTMTLNHENTNSTAANRIHSPTGADVTVATDGHSALSYDGFQGRWVIVSKYP